ncbi:MAG: Uma2 family endonuclease [Armatimonadetes bacterium]|jgi:Uma2 family endonuclease|nr:Uma2 family endonuclease [Armatimonadota bacterium]
MASRTVAKPEVERRWTLEEWLKLPEGPPFYELEDGRLIEIPSPRVEHQEIVGVLYFLLRQFVREHDLGTVVMAVDVALPTGRGYIPDLTFIRRDRERELIGEDGKIHGAPDLVVEVISPSTKVRDRYKKMEGYFEAGVEWVWLIDSEDLTAEEFHRTEEGYLRTAAAGPNDAFEPKALPGLKINLPELLSKPAKKSGQRKRSR